MTFTWADFRSAEPDFADTVRQRFQMYPHHVLATLRKDGSPRVSGLEVPFLFGELWLGMMPNSLKALDLLRDPRLNVQANPGSGNALADGDVRIGGRALAVTDESLLARVSAEVGVPLPFHLFRVELSEVVWTGMDGEDMVVRIWRPGQPLRTVRRGAGEGPPREEDA
ncbi:MULTISPECIES: pyridoxamine 5'-phosphate oxidase family protein [unclassified Streptomyces]|uniref:pyridoxamine 5'-phosphate oxidase family protein n=1 Tax=unclassified Streptomyces TaxID=2593676 RepID=UPI00081EC238|nr:MULTISPECIES: pyridoxamine 5'-phosphate oxidase family protein [unclassified Streptomyces]MYZ37450.1 pyridoxamine 5'-phosphate oxidase family protein [Streptomyces sp. SID4917]SCF91388.1 Pyridoxamine 5'-phosphate oxidase [Streptomyces sp. MnatMP-M17]